MIENHMIIVGTTKTVVQKIIVEATPSPMCTLLVTANVATAVGCEPMITHCLATLGGNFKAMHHRSAKNGPMRILTTMQKINCTYPHETSE